MRLLRRERLYRAAVEDPALDRAALEHAPLGRVELVEAGREQRVDRGRYRDVAVPPLSRERDHLLDEQRIALGRLLDARTQPLVEVAEARDQSFRLLVRQGFE